MSRKNLTAVMYGVIIVLCIGIGTSIFMLINRPEDVMNVDGAIDSEYVPDDIVMIEETTSEEPSGETKIEPVDRVVITGDNVNVRSAASTEADRLGSAYRGYDFEYLGDDESGEWFMITYDGKTGFVFKDFGTIKTMYLGEDGSYLEY